MTKLDKRCRMTIATLKEKGVPKTEIARMLEVTEGAVRYPVVRSAAGAVDGRTRQPEKAGKWREVIAAWVSTADGRLHLAALHEHLRCEHGYEGSLRSVQRFVGKHFPKPKLRARRRVETPPGAQAQADWAEFRSVMIGGELVDLYAFHMRLSHSRRGATIWSTSKDQLAWQQCHVAAFQRLGGVPATVRIDNEKTAIARGAGAWGEVNPSYRRFAQTLHFHVDACPPRTPEARARWSAGSTTWTMLDTPPAPETARSTGRGSGGAWRCRAVLAKGCSPLAAAS